MMVLSEEDLNSSLPVALRMLRVLIAQNIQANPKASRQMPTGKAMVTGIGALHRSLKAHVTTTDSVDRTTNTGTTISTKGGSLRIVLSVTHYGHRLCTVTSACFRPSLSAVTRMLPPCPACPRMSLSGEPVEGLCPPLVRRINIALPKNSFL